VTLVGVYQLKIRALKLFLAGWVFGRAVDNVPDDALARHRSSNACANDQAVDVSVSGGGVFLKGSVDPAPGVQLFAKVGVVDARVTEVTNGAWATGRSTSASYGVGAHIDVGTSTYLQLDYISYYDKDGVQARGPALSIGYKF
jgi:hypothetical protein